MSTGSRSSGTRRWLAWSLAPAVGLLALAGRPSRPGTGIAFPPVASSTGGSAGFSNAAVTTETSVARSLAITTATLPGGSQGTSYGATLAVSSGTPPYVWTVSAGTLPTGLSLDPQTGAIVGRPGAAGMYAFDVTVTAGVEMATRTILVTIATPEGSLWPDGTVPGGFA